MLKGRGRSEFAEEGRVDLPAPVGDPAAFADALDCDLGLSPATNLMPVLRHGLLSGGDPVELTTAWVSSPTSVCRLTASGMASCGRIRIGA